MNLRTKIFLFIGVILITFFLLIGLSFRYVLTRDFSELEQREMNRNLSRVTEALSGKFEEVSVKLSDWAQWDDTYEYISDHNEEYIQSNLQNVALDILRINAVVLTDENGDIIFKKFVEQGEDQAFPQDFEDHLKEHQAEKALSPQSDPYEVHKEIVHLSDKVILYVSRAITSSDGLSPPRGTIIFGYIFDESAVRQLSQLTRLDITFSHYEHHDENGVSDAGFDLARQHLSIQSPNFIDASGGEDTLFGYTIVSDDDSNPVLIFRVALPREIYQRGVASIRLFFMFMLFSGLLFSLSMVYVLRHFILSKLSYLAKEVDRIRLFGNADNRIILPGEDEFSHLAGRINEMLISRREMEIKKKNSEKRLNEIAEARTKELREKIIEGEQSKLAILNILEDVGASERQLQQKTEDLQKFQQAVDASFDHMIITDADGVILHANHAAEVLTGYTKEEMIGAKPSLWGRQMSKSFYETLWKTIKVEKQGYAGEVTNKRKGGQLYLASIRVSSILDAAGEVKFFVGIERDITEEREVQRRIIRHADELEIANNHIEEQKDRAESILRFLRSIGEGVFATDIAGNIIFINETAQRMSSKPHLDAEGRKVSEVFSFAQEMPYQSVMISIVEQSLESKKAISFPLNTVSVQYTMAKIPVAGTCSPIRDTKGNIIGVIVVFRDVTQLRELDQMKNNFLSTAAHQLRTPLGSMRWSAELLINGDFGKLPKAAKEIVRQIYDNNVRMVLLVNDLLDVSRIDSEKGREEKQLVDIATLLQEIIHTMQSEARKRSVKIILTLPKEPLPLLLMPAKHLYEALENLVSNGIKYNKKRGILTLTVQRDASAILLTVADTGIGIPKEDTAKIFSKFFRSANAVLKETEGSGLGLSVVKSYLEESGAKISFTSEENIGTTFLVEFPLDSGEEHT